MTLAGQVWCVNNLLTGQSQRRNPENKWYVVVAAGIGLIIVASDEIIQSFTGRTSSITDVLIDFAGVVIGMTLVCLVILFIRLKRNKP